MLKSVAKKKYNKGIALLVIGLLIYLAYWVILLEPVQSKFAGTGEYPSRILMILAAIVVSLVSGSLVLIGNGLIKDKVFGIEHTDFTFGALIRTKAYYGIIAILIAATIFFTLVWRSDL